MKKCQSAQRLLVRRLTATSKEWREINKETKRLSISKERELRSPKIAQNIQLKDYNFSRNDYFMENDKRPSPLNNIDAKYTLPFYSQSTRNLVRI